jgi:hypothetical protein
MQMYIVFKKVSTGLQNILTLIIQINFLKCIIIATY